jgi:hypothetical protein
LFLDFQTNVSTSVEELENGLWRVSTTFMDNLFGGKVILEVKEPALDIRTAYLEITRDDCKLSHDISALGEKLIGVRVGPGMTKIVRGLVGGPSGSDRIAELVLESMEMLINGLTLPELRAANENGGIPFEFSGDDGEVKLNDQVIGDEMVRVMATNPRLRDSCAAFRGL